MAEFYVVATPIGNLEDITLRALRILKEVDLILCEDTRVTKKLLARYQIGTPTMSYHAHSRISKVETILKLLEGEKNIALVSDAGTPGISDPAARLVEAARRELGNKARIIPVPGASALTAALSVSGLPADRFTFFGFLPRKKGRQTALREIAACGRTAVFYESPHRILKTLKALAETLRPERTVVAGREITKIFEEFRSGSPAEVYNYFLKHPEKIRGEFTIIASPARARYNRVRNE